MHNNYYFLKKLSKALASRLTGAVFRAAYSQEKDELIMVLETSSSHFYIRAFLNSSFCCLSFPGDHSRARKNSVDLFEALQDRVVTSVRQFINERCFALVFGEWQLLFKLYGNRANLVLWNGDTVVELFRNQLRQDQTLQPGLLDRPIRQDREMFMAHQGELAALFPTFGKVIRTYLSAHNYESMSLEARWEFIQDLLARLDSGTFYVTSDYPQRLTLLSPEEKHERFDDPLVAVTTFFHLHQSATTLEKTREEVVRQLVKNISRAENYLDQNTGKLAQLTGRQSYRQVADLLMANMHAISPGKSEVILENFYNENRPVKIKLQPKLSPQENAAVYYRKAKNQHIQIAQLQRSGKEKRLQLEEERSRLTSARQTNSLKELRQLIRTNEEQKVQSTSKPFRTVEYDGYTILIGKNAQSNDTMLRLGGHKDDLWLHAKDAAGSHVIIRQQSGRTIPVTVRERAAQLAAWYSRRRSDTYVLVIVTPRKYVRKRKGDPPGMVVVDREEEVMMVEARGN